MPEDSRGQFEAMDGMDEMSGMGGMGDDVLQHEVYPKYLKPQIRNKNLFIIEY